MKLYHGTNETRARIILTEGLLPQPINLRIWNKGGTAKPRPEHRATSVYLCNNLELALSYAQYAARKEGCSPAILTIALPHTENLRADDDYLRISNPLDYRNWETAFLITGQVAHESSISPEFIS